MLSVERRCAAGHIKCKWLGLSIQRHARRVNALASYDGCSSRRVISDSIAALPKQRCMTWPRSRVLCACESRPVATEDDIVRYASVGDIVTINFVMRDEDGKVVQSSSDLGAPLFFEVGAGDLMGNRLFQGFDEAVRGMAVGQTTVLEASGGEWKRELLFTVERQHPEIQRLEGRYKNHGGLAAGLVVELANGAMAVILEVTDAEVKLDANNMLAGKTFTIELELVSIDSAPPTGEGSPSSQQPVPEA